MTDPLAAYDQRSRFAAREAQRLMDDDRLTEETAIELAVDRVLAHTTDEERTALAVREVRYLMEHDPDALRETCRRLGLSLPPGLPPEGRNPGQPLGHRDSAPRNPRNFDATERSRT